MCTESTPPAHRFLVRYVNFVSQHIFLERMRLRSVLFMNWCRQSNHSPLVATSCVQNPHTPPIHWFSTQCAILVSQHNFVEDEIEISLTFFWTCIDNRVSILLSPRAVYIIHIDFLYNMRSLHRNIFCRGWEWDPSILFLNLYSDRVSLL